MAVMELNCAGVQVLVSLGFASQEPAFEEPVLMVHCCHHGLESLQILPMMIGIWKEMVLIFEEMAVIFEVMALMVLHFELVIVLGSL